MRTRNGCLQVPAILEVPLPYRGKDHRAIGVRCPRCQQREVVYNGNYFCYGFDSGECGWVLDHYDVLVDPGTGRVYDSHPCLWDLEDLLVLIGCAKGRRGSPW